MSAPSRLQPPPAGGYLAWVTQSPEEVAAYLRTVYALQNFTINLVVGGVTSSIPVVISGQNATVTLTIS